MRKISKARNALTSSQAGEPDERPGRISGATITSWSGAASLEFSSLFPAHKPHTTVGGTMSKPDSHESEPSTSTIALSDGTQITFADSNSIVHVD